MSNDDAIRAMVRHGDRRRRRLNFVMRERRSGFDRRRPDTWPARLQGRALACLRDEDRNVFALLAIANVLNVLDLLFTLRALAHGAEEANPIMRALFSFDPWAAGAVKVVLVLGVSLLIWRFRRYRLTLLAGVVLPLVFGLVFLYHLYGLALTAV